MNLGVAPDTPQAKTRLNLGFALGIHAPLSPHSQSPGPIPSFSLLDVVTKQPRKFAQYPRVNAREAGWQQGNLQNSPTKALREKEQLHLEQISGTPHMGHQASGRRGRQGNDT